MMFDSMDDEEWIDAIIRRLLVADLEKDRQSNLLSLEETVQLCDKAAEVFLSQPSLLELQAPIKICGDIFGNHGDLLHIFDCAGFPPKSNYLFLGNCIYGEKCYGALCLLLAYKIKYPDNFFLLRSECDEYDRIGILGHDLGDFVWPMSVEKCLNCMPVAAIIDKKIFCVHGGISPELDEMDQIKRIERPVKIHQDSLIDYLVSAKPHSEIEGWGTTRRFNPSSDIEKLVYKPIFGTDIVSEFLEKHDLDLICRGSHRVLENGFEFFGKGELVSIFSAPNFQSELYGKYRRESVEVILDIDDTFMLRFLTLRKAINDTLSDQEESELESESESGDVDGLNGSLIMQMMKNMDVQLEFQDYATNSLRTIKIGHKKKLEVVIEEELEATNRENPTVVVTQPNLELAPETVAKDLNDHSHTVDYGILQLERDNALKEAEALRLKIQQLSASTSESSSLNISYVELQQATNNFDSSMKIEEDALTIVYKGFLRGTNIAIKTLRPERQINQSGFDKEAAVLSKVRHPNLATLIGFCSEPFALVYEYLSMGSLEDRLVCKNDSPPLSWQVRIRIISEIRSALIFLHSTKPQPLVHGDLKPDHIFLDANMVSKLGDFGICSFLDSSSTNTFYHLTEQPKGTPAYIDPEYIRTGELTMQSDVYSFGVIILRLVTGKPAKGVIAEAQKIMDEWGHHSVSDPSAGDWPAALAKELIKLGLDCCEIDRKKRPELSGEAWKAMEATIINSLSI